MYFVSVNNLVSLILYLKVLHIEGAGLIPAASSGQGETCHMEENLPIGSALVNECWNFLFFAPNMPEIIVHFQAIALEKLRS